jgi:hypothetical protein
VYKRQKQDTIGSLHLLYQFIHAIVDDAALILAFYASVTRCTPLYLLMADSDDFSDYALSIELFTNQPQCQVGISFLVWTSVDCDDFHN